jgi:hypothetical protein
MMEDFIEALREMRAPFRLVDVMAETGLGRYFATRNLTALVQQGVLFKQNIDSDDGRMTVYNFAGKLAYDPEDRWSERMRGKRYEDMRFKVRAVA